MKERLTGAIILVALIVLLVPELLTGPVRSAPRAASIAPSAEEPPLRSYTINLADDTRARTAAAHTSGPEQPAPLGAAAASPNAGSANVAPANAAPAAPAATPSAATSTAPAMQTVPGDSRSQIASPPPPAPPQSAPPKRAPPAATAPPAPAAAGGSGAWVVQLGSFASRANAERLARRVRAQGFQVGVSQGSSGRRLYRVRVGPVHDQAAASQLAQKLRASGHGGSVVPR